MVKNLQTMNNFFHNIQNGDVVMTRNAFIIFAILSIVAALVAKIVFHVDFSQLSK